MWDHAAGGAELNAMFNGGDAVEIPYLMADLAGDAAGLMAALDLEPAHIVGASMGGMIVQQIAIDYPERVASLTSIMSTTGSSDHGQAAPEVLEALIKPAPAEREAALDHMIENAKIWGSPEWFDPALTRERLGEAWDRVGGPQPDGMMRQMAAIVASGSREDGLAQLDVPTLVIHGDEDRLVTPSGGERTAEIIPGADLMMLEGMGHDLPPIYWQQIIEGTLQMSLAAGQR